MSNPLSDRLEDKNKDEVQISSVGDRHEGVEDGDHFRYILLPKLPSFPISCLLALDLNLFSLLLLQCHIRTSTRHSFQR